MWVWEPIFFSGWWSKMAKFGSSTMLNLIVNCFYQFLRKIMPFLTLIPNFLALILLVIEIFVWNFIMGPYIDLSWVPSGSKLTLKRSKLCYKSQFYVIFLNYRASILVFDHLRHWMAVIFLVFVSRSQKLSILWPLEGQILLNRDSKNCLFARKEI